MTDEHKAYLDRKFYGSGFPSRDSRPASSRLSSMEKELMKELPPRLSMGFISEPLWFSPAFRSFNKSKMTALHRLVRRGLLKVVHETGPGHEDYVLIPA